MRRKVLSILLHYVPATIPLPVTRGTSALRPRSSQFATNSALLRCNLGFAACVWSIGEFGKFLDRPALPHPWPCAPWFVACAATTSGSPARSFRLWWSPSIAANPFPQPRPAVSTVSPVPGRTCRPCTVGSSWLPESRPIPLDLEPIGAGESEVAAAGCLFQRLVQVFPWIPEAPSRRGLPVRPHRRRPGG